VSLTLAQLAGDALDYTGQTSVHPVGFAVLLVLAGCVFVLPRAWSLAPLLILACFVPAGQRIVLAGTLDFSFLRILVIAYWVRIFLFQDWRGLRVIALDYAVIAWVLVGSFVYVLLRMDFPAVVNRLGFTYESLGLYVTMRCMLGNWARVERAIAVLAVLALPVAVFFLVEQATGRNLFSVMGGVPEQTLVREGRVRAQGAFSHPIIAGCFWANVVVLCAGMFMARRRAALMVCGFAGACLIVVACASSTPVLAVLVGGLGMALAYVRGWIGYLRLGFAGMLVFLHFVMEAPIWHLISRISAVGGSTGWHRYHLIDAAIRNFGEWAVLGVETTMHWGHGLRDVTNQYVLEGVRGGVWTLALFLLVLVLAFRAVGKGLRRSPSRRGVFWVQWAVGVSLLVHATNFVAVSYFGQGLVAFYLSLALAGSVQQLSGSGNTRGASDVGRTDRQRGRGQLQHPGIDARSPGVGPRRDHTPGRVPRGG